MCQTSTVILLLCSAMLKLQQRLIGFSLGHDILKRQIENQADENNRDDKNGLENMIQKGLCFALFSHV